jgi:hypothetical protein
LGESSCADGRGWEACAADAAGGEKSRGRVAEWEEVVLGAAAIVVAVAKALEEDKDAQTHATILAPSKDGWRELEGQFRIVRR